jgi:hypothetical protein
MKRQGYDAQTIATAIDKATIVIPEEELIEPAYAAGDAPDPVFEDYFAE